MASQLSVLAVHWDRKNLTLYYYFDIKINTVFFHLFQSSESFLHYKSLARQLQRVNLESLTKEQKLAFFINVYNALVYILFYIVPKG